MSSGPPRYTPPRRSWTAPRKLLRFVSRMEPIGPIKLPPATTWCDAETIEPLKVEFDFIGLDAVFQLPEIGCALSMRDIYDELNLPVFKPRIES